MTRSGDDASALLTISLGPVQTFIAQARRIADLWTGSHLLSHLVAHAMDALPDGRRSVVFPALLGDADEGDGGATGLPNRFVARVPAAEASDVAASVAAAVRTAWSDLLDQTEAVLAPLGLAPGDPRLRDNAEQTFEVAWSWVPESGTYAAAADAGARRFAASRLFRPFSQREELGEKCAICGERTALPDGRRAHVREGWQRAEASTSKTADGRFFRFEQTRLCLVCAAKRVYARPAERRVYFHALEEFQPGEEFPYFALVQLDGDHMGKVLGWGPERVRGSEVEAFHAALSRGLHTFARQLASPQAPHLATDALGIKVRGRQTPELIYAGGDDVLLVCDPRDAIPAARAIRERYRAVMRGELGDLLTPSDLARITLSGAIVVAHTRQPAGLTLRDAASLLKTKAKGEAGRDALAIRLDKRGGVPVETAFRWDEGPDGGDQTWLELLDTLVDDLRQGRLSSGQTFNLRQEERLLRQVFAPEHWQPWLADRLGRSRTTDADDEQLAARIAPFFIAGKAEALRIVRFLGRELESQPEPQEVS
jgi:CRISPR-associated protein Cmr2